MVEVAFYIASKGRIADKVMAFFMRSKHSHTELVLDDLCHSASKRDGGVRAKAINLNDGKWEVFELPADNKRKAFDFYEETKGSKYDTLSAVLNQVFEKMIDFAKGRFYCTEWTIKAYNRASNNNLSPHMQINEFYKYCKYMAEKWNTTNN